MASITIGRDRVRPLSKTTCRSSHPIGVDVRSSPLLCVTRRASEARIEILTHRRRAQTRGEAATTRGLSRGSRGRRNPLDACVYPKRQGHVGWVGTGRLRGQVSKMPIRESILHRGRVGRRTEEREGEVTRDTSRRSKSYPPILAAFARSPSGTKAIAAETGRRERARQGSDQRRLRLAMPWRRHLSVSAEWLVTKGTGPRTITTTAACIAGVRVEMKVDMAGTMTGESAVRVESRCGGACLLSRGSICRDAGRPSGRVSRRVVFVQGVVSAQREGRARPFLGKGDPCTKAMLSTRRRPPLSSGRPKLTRSQQTFAVTG